eukprot:m.185519 g.185519  ORF g.185519 m.185519 type:complete len:57 (-) comp16684_c1_seq3:16-186(-)
MSANEAEDEEEADEASIKDGQPRAKKAKRTSPQVSSRCAKALLLRCTFIICHTPQK